MLRRGPAKSFTEEALLAAITKIELGNLKEIPDGPSGAPVRTLVWLARLFARG